jgi:hypothetical protein
MMPQQQQQQQQQLHLEEKSVRIIGRLMTVQ